jgi:hypothetical protein
MDPDKNKVELWEPIALSPEDRARLDEKNKK